MNSIIELNETNFDREVTQSSQTVVVDFWAEWCGPCKMLSPALDEMAREQDGRVTVAKVNIDQNAELTARFNIQSIPTLLYFSAGELRGQTVGLVSKQLIIAKLAALQAQPEPAQAG